MNPSCEENSLYQALGIGGVLLISEMLPFISSTSGNGIVHYTIVQLRRALRFLTKIEDASVVENVNTESRIRVPGVLSV